jgi:hypothetical protein
MECHACQARPASIQACHFGQTRAFCGSNCSDAYHVSLVGPPLDAVPHQLEFDGTRLGAGVLHGSTMFSNWQLTSEGINLQGGFVTLHVPGMAPVDVLAKRLSKSQVLAAIVADRLKQLFMGGPLTTGSRYAQVRFDTTITLERPTKLAGKTEQINVAKAGENYWFLLLKRITDAPMLRNFVVQQYGLYDGVRHLQLPGVERDEEFMRGFARTFAYRMLVGITDPGPGNFLVKRDQQGLPRFYSLDEASAFDPKLAPGPVKPWLQANMAKAKGRKEAIDSLRPLLPYITELTASSWRNQPDQLREQVRAQLAQVLDLSPKQRDEWLRYVTENLNSLERDWAELVDAAPAPMVVAQPPAPPSMNALALEPPPEPVDPGGDEPEFDVDKEVAEHELLIQELQQASQQPVVPVLSLPGQPHLVGTSDLHESYYKLSFGAGPQRYQKSQIKSLLQKAIRRNLPQLAQFAAAMMLGSFQVTNLCNRLLTIACEDISVGNLECLRTACKLERLRQELYSSKKLEAPNQDVARWRQELRNSERFRKAVYVCVAMMCQSPKSRLCDHAGMVLLTKSVPGIAPLVASEWQAQLDLVQRGALDSEEALFRAAQRHIDPSDHKLSVRNMMIMTLGVASWLRLHQMPELARVAQDCHFSLEARNATHPQKIAGKNNFSTALLLVTRPRAEIQVQLDLDLSDVETQVQPLYVRLIAGQQLPVMPAWALDKHTGRGPEKPNESFIVAEQQALEPRHHSFDHYYVRAFELSKQKDQKLFAEQEQKRVRKRRTDSTAAPEDKRARQ